MTNFATTRNNYRFSSGKQCICTYKLQKPPISAPTEMGGFVLVGRFPNPSQRRKICGYAILRIATYQGITYPQDLPILIF